VVSLLKVWMYNLSGMDRGGLELELLLAMADKIYFTSGARRKCLVLFSS